MQNIIQEIICILSAISQREFGSYDDNLNWAINKLHVGILKLHY